METKESVDPLHPALILLTARPDFFAQRGSVDVCFRRRGDKTYGPYYRLRYRDGGSSRSLYLGRAGPLVDRIRHVLQTLQGPMRRHRAFVQVFRQVRDALRLDRRCVDARLRGLGLRLKGFEVRGWRTSPLRVLGRGTAPIIASMKPGQFPWRRALASMQIKPFRVPRASQLRFVPKGRATKWFRANRPKIPRGPQARLQAVLDARNRDFSKLRQ